MGQKRRELLKDHLQSSCRCQGSAHQQTQALGGDDNPFRRSEEWMPAVPVAEHKNWRSRPIEVKDF